MGSKFVLRAWAAAMITAAWLVVATAALAMPAHSARSARAAPWVDRAWGLLPALGHASDIPGVTATPVVFHGGVVMRNVHVHTVFWAPSTYAFPPAPGPGTLGYEALMHRFFTDAANAPATSPSALTVTDQYGDRSGAGGHNLSYGAGTDSIDDADRFPSHRSQCSSPVGLPVCLTAEQIESELDRVVARQDPSGRGLHDLWVMLLAPNVDMCIQDMTCGTTAFAGYHSQFDLGRGPTIYALVVNPLIEGVPPQGIDPEGNPVAEVAANVAAHETVEAVSDPEGTGWIDPTGAEVGDKCQASYGTLLGYANGSPYNQLLSGDPFLTQTMWSNTAMACVAQGSPAPPPSLPTVSLRQFSAVISGSSGTARAGVAVHVALVRDGLTVGAGRARTGSSGAWTTTLRAPRTGAPKPVGDDRDELDISYLRGGPPAESILTGQGGNPEGQAGYTGWSLLDSGFAVGRHRVVVAPCSQVGVLTLRVDGRQAPPLVDRCQTSSDESVTPTGPIGPGSVVLLSSTDNRASSPTAPAGALVRLTIRLGEPGSIGASNSSGSSSLPNTGFPTCSADLSRQTASCTGLVPGQRYRATTASESLSAWAGRRGEADFAARGHVTWLAGGDIVILRGLGGQVLSALHVARLRVALNASGRVIGGVCQPGEYWGAPSNLAPESSGEFVLPPFFLPGESSSAPDTVCPLSGHAPRLPGDLLQTDSFSGGATLTTVPSFSLVSPANAATLYGPFIAVARVTGAPRTGPHPRVSLQITPAGRSHPVLVRLDVDTVKGALVRGLHAGLYHATWTVTDRNGDTRTLHTYFVQEP